jgi:hypothetical protein
MTTIAAHHLKAMLLHMFRNYIAHLTVQSTRFHCVKDDLLVDALTDIASVQCTLNQTNQFESLCPVLLW